MNERERLEQVIDALKARVNADKDVHTMEALLGAVNASKSDRLPRHSEAVATFAVALAEGLDLSEEETSCIRYAALLHDIGKIGIPEHILMKPGPLTPEERNIVETHPQAGASAISDYPHLQDLVPLICHHHEHYDGAGYPDGLRGEETPLGARIIAIAEAFDVMIREQVYRPAISIPEALAVLQQKAGRQFDPDLVQSFVDLVRRILD
jgi:putative nucleotidyltransferase with HDIG domain